MEQIKNSIFQMWNDWTIASSPSVEVLQNSVPDEIPQNLMGAKAADTAFMHASPSLDCRITDNAEILSIQQKEGILKAAGHAIVAIGHRYHEHLKGENLPKRGLISTCNPNLDESTICVGGRLNVDCVKEFPSSPESYPFPMILNHCVHKFYKEQLPELLKGQPDATCFEMEYNFDTYKIEDTEPGYYDDPHHYGIDLHACVGHKGVDGVVKMDNAYQAVRDGDLEAAKGVIFSCKGAEVFDSPLECLQGSESHSIFVSHSPFPKNEMAHDFFELSKMWALNCYRFEYEFTPSQVTYSVCEAAAPLAIAENS